MTRLRIKDIAELANVSIGTVDRVIHKREGVSKNTREKIQQLLEEHNFAPDPNASSLAMKRQVNLGVFMPGTVNEHVFWDLPKSGVDRAYQDLSNYRINLERFYFDQMDRDDFMRMMDKIKLEQLDGVLFAPVFQQESLAFIQRCKDAGIPVVLINSMLEEAPISCFVGQDARQSGYVAGKLISYGLEYRKDVLVINMSARKDHYSHLIARERGFRTYFEEHGGKLEHLVTIDLSGEDDRVLAQRLDALWKEYSIGGIFVSNSRVYKIAEYLERKGVMGTRLVGYDLLPQSIRYLERDYIHFIISQRPEVQAYKGLTSLFYLVAFDREPLARQMMPIDIITRENLGYYKQNSL